MKRVTLPLFSVSLVIALVLGLLPLTAAPAQAAPTELFFSEYIEGTSNNKALEIYNGTGADIDLAAGGYNVQMFFNGSATAGLTINLSGTLADGDVFVLAHAQANATILAQADQTNSAGWYNGDDAVVLRKGTTIIDVIGQIGVDPGSEWGSGLASTADNTLRRKATIQAGDPNGNDDFDPALEWDGFATDTFDGLGWHTIDTTPVEDLPPTVTMTVPADGAEDFPASSSLTVTFSEPVSVSDGAFSLVCGEPAEPVELAVSGGPATYILDPAFDLPNGVPCTLTVESELVVDQDEPLHNMAADYVVNFTPVDVCSLPYTPIYEIQGSGAVAAITGDVTTFGVVIGDYEGPSPTLRGFYLQDPSGDGDEATSDGIFVFNGNADEVQLGDLVRVSGTAAEFQEQTQISASEIVFCGTGMVEPVDVTLPAPSPDYLERFEGMLVRFPQTLYVTEHFQLGRFGQVTLSSGGRLFQPTHLVPPGAEAAALQAENNLNRIILDDDLNNQNPDPILFARGGEPLSASNTLRGGDTITGLTGVMTYTLVQ